MPAKVFTTDSKQTPKALAKSRTLECATHSNVNLLVTCKISQLGSFGTVRTILETEQVTRRVGGAVQEVDLEAWLTCEAIQGHWPGCQGDVQSPSNCRPRSSAYGETIQEVGLGAKQASTAIHYFPEQLCWPFT